MASTKYSDMLDDVLPYLAADPSDPVTEKAIQKAAIEFCRGSWIWQDTPDPLDVVAGESEYSLEPPPGADAVAVLSVELDGYPLGQRDLPALSRLLTISGTPRHFAQKDTTAILLAPVPDGNQAGGLAVSLALQPSLKSTGMPQWIYHQFGAVIAEGALARLMLMPERPWTDINGGLTRRAYFEACIANARADAAHGLGGAPIRVMAHF